MAKYNLKEKDYWQNDDGSYEDENGIFIFRTVGGRIIRIYEGQNLTEAMKKSGKFESAKKKEVNTNKQTEQNKIDKEVSNMYGKDLKEAYNALEDDDDSYEAKAIRKEYDKRTANEKKFHETTKSMMKENNQSSDDESFTMTNGDKSVTVSKNDEGKWEDSEGNKYMGYLSKEDVKSYFKGDWKEAKQNDIKQLKEKIGNDVKKLQDEAHKRGILPSELQDQLGIKDSDLGLKDDYTEKFEQEMQGMERYLKAEEAKKVTSSNLTDQQKKLLEMKKSGKFKELLGDNDEKSMKEAEARLIAENKNPSKPKVEYSEYNRKIDEENERRAKEYKRNADELRKVVKETKNDDVWIKQENGSYKANEDAMKKAYEERHKKYDNKIKQLAEDRNKMTNGDWEASIMAYEKQNADGTYKTFDDIYEDVEKYEKNSNNSAYKKAFEEYKKKHPNSKLTLNKFIDMSEGK